MGEFPFNWSTAASDQLAASSADRMGQCGQARATRNGGEVPQWRLSERVYDRLFRVFRTSASLQKDGEKERGRARVRMGCKSLPVKMSDTEQ